MTPTIESQNTITNGDRISGELVIRFRDIPLDSFLKYRKAIREITGFGTIGIDHFTVNETALVTENNLERRPHEHRVAVPAVIGSDGNEIKHPDTTIHQPTIRNHIEPAKPAHGKTIRNLPRASRYMKEFIRSELVGRDQGTIVAMFRGKFKNRNYTDGEIIYLYNKTMGVV